MELRLSNSYSSGLKFVFRLWFFFLRVLSLDTSSSTYFPLFQLALRPASMPDSNRRRSSISPPRNHVAFSLAKQVSFEHSISSPSLLLLREGKKNIQTNDRQMTRQNVSPQFVVDRSSARPDRDRGQRCSATTFLSNSKYSRRVHRGGGGGVHRCQ